MTPIIITTTLLRPRRLPPNALLHQYYYRRAISNTPHLFSTPDDGPRKAQKKVNKEKRGSSAAVLKAKETKSNQMTELMRKAIDAPQNPPPPASHEEMERRYHIGRNYVIGCFKQHNEMNHDLAVKIRMKRYAIRQLPKEGQLGDILGKDGKSVYGMWREETFKVDDNCGPPDHRRIAMDTPPIPGFDPSIYMDMEEEDI